MAMQKAHNNINWENKPSDKTPLNERNLNQMDRSIDVIDNRVITLDTSKFDKIDAQGLIKKLEFNRANGVFTITYFNGSTATIDTMLEKLAVNFDFDETAQRMIITLDDGTKKYVDLSAFIVPLEFVDSGTIAFQLLANGKVTAIVKEGSIEEKHLRPNYLADIKVEAAKAQASASEAKASENKAKGSEEKSKRSEENAKESELAAKASEIAADKSKVEAGKSETASKTSELAAKSSESRAKESEENAKASEQKSKESEQAAKASEQKSKGSEQAAASSASVSAYNAQMAQSWTAGGTGLREGEDYNNSKYFAQMAEQGAARSGWLRFRINSKGQLVMYRRGINDIKFVMRNGILGVILGWKENST